MMYRMNLDDIRNWVESYEGEKFHAILTDPPYNLESIKKRFGKPSAKPAKHGVDGAFSRVSKGFMGKTWDTDVAFDPALWEKIKDLLYPGAFGIAFMGARTYHRLAVAVEDAGFIIHPMIGWVQSQGFPKGTRIDTQIDRALKRERELIADIPTRVGVFAHAGDGREQDITKYSKKITKPASRLAEIWSGHRYGLMTLKPCLEPALMFQKPYEGKPFKNIVKTGAGALNIKDTEFSVGRTFKVNTFDDGAKPFGDGVGHEYTSREKSTLYPTTFIIDEFTDEPYTNFFYQAKVSPKERDAGLDELPDTAFVQSGGGQSKLKQGEATYKQKSLGLNRVKKVKNTHPTLKPIDLNKYFAKLLLPPSYYSPRRLLVPFSGAGSEIIGALLAGWDYVEGIELEEGSIDIAEKRIRYWLRNEQE